ncbi:3-ketoacyl-ACP reductase [Paracoccus chinensis]|uniref:NAD(P)-dependent dehydrogenase, short-chain alcohol dehydrogenase family n=1 Tax=Paracoccus chinensis TaxID=525640 RepID=A0A1G9DVG4_9RHOB|nr:3-ketoacyl-ACP reductase [Paracoccus chinensis]SDK67853.1 NAD(P)-dependent dehydrogenase, short-chain alcohol dehydrogenase family [Paracoccus chinensis]
MSRITLITGGQQGIGLGIATALAGAGWTVALAAERPEDDPAVTEALGALPGARYFRHDLTDIAAAPGLVERVEAALGPITTFVSNAGVPALSRGDMLEMSADSFDLVMGVNLRGGFFLAQAVARRMVDTPAPNYRAMIFVTSVSAELVSVERAEYCLSKAAASMMTRLYAARLAPEGIGVFELRPGIIRTAMTEGVAAKYDARIAEGLVPAGRWGVPADIGAAVLPLAEGAMAFSTGAVIPVDGGLSLHRL